MDLQIKELSEKLLRQQTLHREVVEKHSAEITDIKKANKLLSEGRLADSQKAEEEIKKLNKAIGELEDKIKTLNAQRIADKTYSTVDGLATQLSESAPTTVKTNFRRVAKSILEDPFSKKYKQAFFARLMDPNNHHGSNEALTKAIQEIKDSADVKPEDSFIKKSLTTVIGDQAGYFCPAEVDLNLQKTLYETSPLRQVATVKTTMRGHYAFRIRTSLPAVAWGASELSEVEDSDNQKYQTGKIAVNELNALPSISLDMLEDSIVNIEQELMDDLTEAFMLAENKAFIEGSGIERPKGILTYAGEGADKYDVEKPLKMEYLDLDLSDYNAADGSVHLADAILNLNARLLAGYKNRAVYLMSRPIKNLIRQIKDKNNQYLFSVGQNWGGVQGVPQIMDGLSGRLNGYPILECDDMPTALEVGKFPILFGNFSKYVILDRIGLRLLRDEVTRKGMVKYWFRKRVGGGFKMLQSVKALRVQA